MRIEQNNIEEGNQSLIAGHRLRYGYTAGILKNAEDIVNKLIDFQIAIPSWALGTGGTRFGRFPGGGEPRSLEEKMEDIGLLHKLTHSAGLISLHIPWDIPKQTDQIKALAALHGLKFDAVNSNTFQDQTDQLYSYKFGSLQNVHADIRRQAINHNIELIQYGVELGSTSLSIWLSDGSSFPGQLNFRNAFLNTLDGLAEIYEALPPEWKMLVEYKAYEPNFYSTTIGDWGQSLLFTSKLGRRAFTLVDLGHHLPNANIEQIVALLLMEGKLGGFHFNDSKYGDDDLTTGSIKPYQLFLIFNELVEGMDNKNMNHASALAWMIDASHNVKDPLEDLLQSIEAIMIAYAQALLVDKEALSEAQQANDTVLCQESLQNAFRTDTRSLVAEARLRTGAALEPVSLYRKLKVRKALISERGSKSIATGL
jgi:L-rhamnose isomerase / sugar isomerase